ncbi:MAG: VOC family protein [Gordonibacter sp.]|uniref:VOC family protein n=1 Tax=Gordonibacter sp. TaxID=1968902 RepID=UPI002FCCAB6B
MGFSLFINFNGNCKDAVDFYARVFKANVEGMMTFDQMPPDPAYTVADEDKAKVMYCSVAICGMNVMFSDVPSGMELTVGDNISPVLISTDKDEIRRMYRELKEAGHVNMELQKTFWSEHSGLVPDQFGNRWQFSSA